MAKMSRTRGNKDYIPKDWFHSQMSLIFSAHKTENESFDGIISKVARRRATIAKTHPDAFSAYPCPVFGTAHGASKCYPCRKVSCPWCFGRLASKLSAATQAAIKSESGWVAVRKTVQVLPSDPESIVDTLWQASESCRLNLGELFSALGVSNADVEGGVSFQWLSPLAHISKTSAEYRGTAHHALTVYVGTGDLTSERVGGDTRPIASVLAKMPLSRASSFKFVPAKGTTSFSLLVLPGYLDYPAFTLHPTIFNNAHFQEARTVAARLRASRAFRQYVSSGCLVSDADK